MIDLAWLRESAEEALSGVNVSRLLLVGSRALGWTHQASDIDFYAITDDSVDPHVGENLDVTVGSPYPRIRITFFDSTRVDTEFWAPQHIESLLSRLRDRDSVGSLSFGDMDVLWRLRTAVDVLPGAETAPALLSGGDVELLNREFAQRAVYSAEARLDDAAGLLESGEAEMAALCARDAYGRVVDGVLSGMGHGAPRSKWRIRRIKSIPGAEDLLRDYLDIESMSSLEDDYAKWTTKTVLASRKLIRGIDGL